MMSQKSLKRTPKETPGTRGRAPKAISKQSNRSLPACDLCTDFISSPEDLLKCEGPCQQYMQKNIKNVRARNGHSNHQKVMKQVTMYKIPHMHVTTEAMTTTHS